MKPELVMAGHRVRSVPWKLLFAHRRHAYGQTRAKFRRGNFERLAPDRSFGVTLRRVKRKNVRGKIPQIATRSGVWAKLV